MTADVQQGGAVQASGELICHCRQVPYETVREAVRSGRACTLAEVQSETTACTKCFGCRFEVEGLLSEELGDRYVPAAAVTRLEEPPKTVRSRLGRRLLRARNPVPTPAQKMYLPVLEGLGGSDVTTRIVLFNLHDEREADERTVAVRADLTRLDGSRQDVWQATVPPKRTSMLDVGQIAGSALPDGVGILKLVTDAQALGSLRPYFQFITPSGITSTHEKRSPRRPDKPSTRRYHWIFPIAPKARPDEAWLFFVNTRAAAIEGCKLSYRSDDGHEESIDVPKLELDQGVCVPLHEHFTAIGDGTASGSVRLTPSVHVAGWIIRRDVEADLWRVQHL